MVMAVDVRLMTADELWKMPDDGRRVELVRGELVDMPPPAGQHGALVANLVGLLHAPIKGQGLGRVFAESGVIIERRPDTVRAPDVSVRLGGPTTARGQAAGYSDQLPTIVFEIVSPSDSAIAVQRKVQSYLRAGVPMVIVVWPDQEEVTVATSDQGWVVLTVDENLDLGRFVSGLSFGVSEIFE